MTNNVTKNKINVLHLRDSAWVDGPGRTIIESGCAIDQKRFNYQIAGFTNTLFKENSFISEAQNRDLKIHCIKERCSVDLRIINQITDLIKNNNIHILHTHDIRSDFFGLICAKIKQIPIITTLHGWIENSLKGKILVTIDKLLLRFFDHVIPVSDYMKDQIRKFGVSKNKITVLYNSLIIDRYFHDKDDYSFRKELGVQHDILLIGNIGRLSPEKGQSIFLKAAKSALKVHKNVKFIIIGSGPDDNRLKKLVKNLGIENSVVFTGYRTDMMRIYNSLDLVVQSSYTEGMPNIILEAMLMEVPVIATNVGGTSEAVHDETTGVLIKPHSPIELAKQILNFISNKQNFKDYANAGSNYIKKNFDFTTRTKNLEKIYTSILLNRKEHNFFLHISL